MAKQLSQLHELTEDSPGVHNLANVSDLLRKPRRIYVNTSKIVIFGPDPNSLLLLSVDMLVNFWCLMIGGSKIPEFNRWLLRASWGGWIQIRSKQISWLPAGCVGLNLVCYSRCAREGGSIVITGGEEKRGIVFESTYGAVPQSPLFERGKQVSTVLLTLIDIAPDL